MVTNYLLKTIEVDEKYNIIHTLFGYALGCINVPLNDRFVFELKKKFQMIQELFLSRMLEK